jgi:propionate CoA-transferase
MLELPFEQRFSYDPDANILFINFERLRVRSTEDIRRIRAAVESRVKSIGRKVYAVVNYTNTEIDPDVFDAYSQMVRELVETCYLDVTRYGSSGFLRRKLGPALAARGVAPHIFESAEESFARVRGREPASDA